VHLYIVQRPRGVFETVVGDY